MRKKVKKKNLNKALMGIALLGIFIIFTTGCDRYTKHKVLTFFFTGVPPLEEEKKVAVVQEVKKIKRRTIPEVTYFIHGPYAARQCYQCHVISPTFSFRKTSKKVLRGIPRLEGQSPGLLVIPLKDLCLECHPPKPVRAAHWSREGPVSEGNCTFCHDPHQSPFRYMLLKKI